MRKTLILAATLMLAGVAVSGCRDGRPGYPGDRHHHGHDHDHDHDGDDHHHDHDR